MELKEAIKKLLEAKKAYYGPSGSPIMSDQEYDAIENFIKEQDPDHPILLKIGSEPSPLWKKAKHDIAMGSLEKVHNEEDFRKWINKFPKGTLFTAQLKFDGLSLELKYESGELKQAITRGDGEFGEDITLNALKFNNIVKTIPNKNPVSIRGEIVLYKSSFEKINEILDEKDKYSNERNASAGISRRLDGAYCKYLNIEAYDILTDFHIDEVGKSKILSDYGFHSHIAYYGDVEAMVKAFGSFKFKRNDLPFCVDGVVIKVCSAEIQESMGEVNGKPKSQIAWKFDPPGAITKFLYEEWPVGRTGVVTPLATLEPVEIEGSIISKATLHNIAEIKRLGIGRGDTIMLIKAGDVIPKVFSVIEHKNNPIEIPSNCPDCGSTLDNDGIKLVCKNERCPSRSFYRILNWIKVVTIDGFGESLLGKLFNEPPDGVSKVKCILDLYNLNVSDISSIEGWGEQSAGTIIDNINNTRHLDPALLLTAIGIPSISFKTSEDLIGAFKSIEGVLNATKEDIVALRGYSDVSATSILEGLRSYSEEILSLLKVIDVSKKEEPQGKLSGMSFCFTGSMSQPRPVYQGYVTSNGGKNLSTVTKDLNFLVCNEDKGSSKIQKAKKYGTKVINEKEFLDMIGVDFNVKNTPTIETPSLF